MLMNTVVRIEISKLYKSPLNPREDTDIEELKTTISAEGVREPLKVRQTGDTYEVLDGSRRLKAARELGIIRDMECIVVACDDAEALKLIALGAQRKDFRPYELGKFYSTWRSKSQLNQEEMARISGVSNSSISRFEGYYKHLSPNVGTRISTTISRSGNSEETIITTKKADIMVSELKGDFPAQETLAGLIESEGASVEYVKNYVMRYRINKGLYQNATEKQQKHLKNFLLSTDSDYFTRDPVNTRDELGMKKKTDRVEKDYPEMLKFTRNKMNCREASNFRVTTDALKEEIYITMKHQDSQMPEKKITIFKISGPTEDLEEE